MNTADLDMLMVVIRLGSFAAAAREMHVDPSSVSRTVAGLEEHLGARLFQRNTRRLALTEAGEAFVERVSPLLDELQQVRHATADAAAQPNGTLRITASNAFGMRRVVPLLREFCEKHPKLKLDVVITDSILDMVAERIDVAIRIGVLRDSTLIAVPLMRMRYRVVASPAWIASLPVPLDTPEDLAHADCLAYSMRSFRESWLFQRDGGPLLPVAVNPRLLSANGLALRELVLTGLGCALLPDWLVSDDLAAGRIVDLFPTYEAKVADAPTGVWLLYPSRSYVPAKVRNFIDFMRAAVR